MIKSIVSKSYFILFDRQYGCGADVARLWVAAADNPVLHYENVNLNTEGIGK